MVEKKITAQVSSMLAKEGFDFEREVAISGLHLDILVHAPKQLTIAIEIKGWEKAPGFRKRAARFAALLAERTKVDVALVVLANLSRSSFEDRVVTPSALVPAIHRIIEEPPLERQEPARFAIEPSAHIFAAMPFDPQYDDVYFIAMTYAAEQVGSVCRRVDLEEFTGDIVTEIEHLIDTADAVIVDLSEAKPNVLYEAGFARASGRPIVHISSTPLSDLPFDISHRNTLRYDAGRTHALRQPLTNRLRASLAGR